MASDVAAQKDLIWISAPCAESGHAMLIATNVFVHEHTRWKMVHHQSSPVSPDVFEITRPQRRESGPAFN